jgi:hypothetical protein
MSQLNDQGNFMMALLEKIKSYDKYSQHKPKIVTGIDTYIDYIDYFFLPVGEQKAGMLVLLTVMPMPGSVFYHDYMLIFINPNSITSVLYDEYYNFTFKDMIKFNNSNFDISSFYKTIIRVTSFGCLNWGVPFRKFALRNDASMYIAAIKSLNPRNNISFTVLCDTMVPDAVRPISTGTIASSYERIESFFIPLMHLDKIGAPLGIYPHDLLDHFNKVMLERSLHKKPTNWLPANIRRKKMIDPYAYGQTVFSEKTFKSYISLLNENIYNPDEEKSIIMGAWKEIDYTKPGSLELVSASLSNPLEDLLILFNKVFDISTICP